MEGKTHRLGGVLCVFAGYRLLESKGLLVNDVNPLLQLAVMYPFAIYGSVFSDLDHHWQSAPAKDPVSFAVNKVLHISSGIKCKSPVVSLFNAKHRSWQTHSDLFLAVLIAIFYFVLRGSPSGYNEVVLKMVMTGFILGVISHLILDSLTPAGIWSILLSAIKGKKVMIHLVPKSKFFATGGQWEKLVRWVICVAIFVYMLGIVYSYCPYKLVINY